MRALSGRLLMSMVLGGLMLAPSVGQAEDLTIGAFFGAPTDTVQSFPNVPNRHGCVRQCIQDLSPCDPPSYKQADGRCSEDH